MSLPVLRTHTDAILGHLETQTSLPVGDAVAPDDIEDASGFIPHLVLYPIVGGHLDGTVANPDEDAALRFQVTAIGETREQAEWAADRARAALLSTALTVTDRRVTRVYNEFTGGTTRDDETREDAGMSLFYAVDRYVVLTTPA